MKTYAVREKSPSKVEKYVIKKAIHYIDSHPTTRPLSPQSLKLNPGVSEHNFRAGATILIPAAGTGVQMISSVTGRTRRGI